MSDRYQGGVIRAVPLEPTSSSASGIWTMEQQAKAQAAGDWPAPPPPPYIIDRSLRFNSADSAYLSRTFSTSGTSRKIKTFSFWVKRSANNNGSGQDYITQCYDGSSARSESVVFYPNALAIRWDSGGNLTSSALYRDYSAWYHVVISIDTTQATDTNRAKMYVNGEQITSFSESSYPSQNADTQFFMSGSNNRIGSQWENSLPMDAYLADFYHIDGQALDPSYFGQTNATTGVWEPIAYAGTYGTNGFHLDFSDNTSTTTLGYDTSGNGNNWTANNFSVTAGAGNDSLVDTPTPYGTDTGAGGEVGGNYCTFNPAAPVDGTFYQGNLLYVGASSWSTAQGTMLVNTGKWYWEVTLTNSPYSPRSVTTNYNCMGFGLAGPAVIGESPSTNTHNLLIGDSGFVYNFGTSADTGVSFTTNDVLGMAVDLDANTFAVYKNGSSIYSGTIGGTVGRALVPVNMAYDGSYGQMTANFGQRPWSYAAPSGFKALCTTNLPAPDVVQGDTAFNTVLYTGNNASNRGITGYGFAPDLIWLKARSFAYNNRLVNKINGTSSTLASNLTSAATDASSEFISLDSDGFTVTEGSSYHFNESPYTYVAWGWKANGAGSSNTDGSITSTVSANTTAGISIVKWSYGGATGPYTVGHGLGQAPSFIITRGSSISSNWGVYHSSLGGTAGINLNQASDSTTNAGWWGDTAPTSSVFTLGTFFDDSADYIAYCFATIEGFSAFGTYTGNNNADGPFVYTGFRPAFVLTKDVTSGSSGNWRMTDNTRNPYNVANYSLFPNLANAESTNNIIDILSNGFKLRESNTDRNPSGGTVIYMAFAENPFKYSLAR